MCGRDLTGIGRGVHEFCGHRSRGLYGESRTDFGGLMARGARG